MSSHNLANEDAQPSERTSLPLQAMCSMERELPEEIKLDIFSRLPPKSIGRCRCLSKQWRALLSQTNFIETHLHLSKTHREKSLIIVSIRLGVLFSVSLSNAHHVFGEITVSASKLSFADRSHSWNAVYGSCNGLLLVDDAEHNMFVLNPTTREIRGVPSWPLDLEDGNNFKYGFGYDSISDDYKIVVHVCHFEDECECEPYCTHEAFFYVYSLKNGTWKRVRSHPFDADVGSAVFLNGRVHWLAHWGDSTSAIVAFDLADEEFHYVPHHRSYDRISMDYRLVVLYRRLWMFNGRRYVRVMMKYSVEESWNKLTINVHERVHIQPLCLWGQEEMVLCIDFSQFVIYNLKEGTLKYIAVQGIPRYVCVRASYEESLVSPNGIATTERG